MAEEENNLWWRKLGFYTNPCTIKPAAFDTKIFGQDAILEDLNYKVPAGTLSFIEGPLGTGKTSLLKNLISKFRGKGKVIYFSCNRIDTELNMEELLRSKYGFWGRLLGLMPTDMIILLDEAQQLTPVNTERIKYFFDQGNIKSAVFTGTDYDKAELHESIKQRIGEDGLFKINELSDDEAITLVRNRIGNSKIVSDEIIKTLWKDTKNPRRMLQKLDKVFRYAVENMESEVKESQLKAIFENTPKTEEVKEETPEEKSAEEEPPQEEEKEEKPVEKKKPKPKKKPKKKAAKKAAKKKEDKKDKDPKDDYY
jgi:predicted AAA+ superfamily ATPase